MWPVGVVLGAEGVHGGLHGLQVGPHVDVVEQFSLQGLVEPFDLPGGCRGAGFGVAGHDAVLPADPFEHHLGRAGLAEPAGELLAVIGEHLLGEVPPVARRLSIVV
ncbi:hypothetical protein [Micromonospora viridifaciens]|uniref:hypothetical protein n=1 Tax=Micromonospora viridifaciens TaxID=1881 RepID=UPI001E3E6A07|nr:hypothetical protein [Micromonospora viridifaciens]